MAEPWQLQLYKRSLKKKLTVGALMDRLPPVQGRLCLEVGCGTGLTSHFLRQRGGTWVSTDFERDHVRSAKQLVGERVLQTTDAQLPFRSASFDVVAAINFLEHIEDDTTFFREMVRVLKPGGDFLFMAPKGETGRPGYALKRVLGFTADRRASVMRGTAIHPRPPGPCSSGTDWSSAGPRTTADSSLSRSRIC